MRAAGVFTWSSVVDHLIVDFGVWWRWKRPVAVGIAPRRSALLDRKIDLARLTVAAGRQVRADFRRVCRLTRVSVHARIVTVLRIEILEVLEISRSVLPLMIWLHCDISVLVLHLKKG